MLPSFVWYDNGKDLEGLFSRDARQDMIACPCDLAAWCGCSMPSEDPQGRDASLPYQVRRERLWSVFNWSVVGRLGQAMLAQGKVVEAWMGNVGTGEGCGSLDG